ncbi:hypothetical protein QR680_001468 [Steinernema hermaphroditum]|uniref:Nonsense-mediated mRNA decay factor SMG8 n=1 Tax=Steinernema hermaphroditum TaxID=289476 RepID=A0AA39GZ99_9BILA|nr:hypothetical protein QR680_001468 [Steinernema hermaphroditum]
MSSTVSIIGTSVLALLLAGYMAQKYGLPAPPPKIVGVDLGTTFSSIGVYHAVSGDTQIIADGLGKRSIPSVVGFLANGSVLIGHRAVEQQEKNPLRTIYDAKRFIGKTFSEDDPQFIADKERYPFTIKLFENGSAYFEIPLSNSIKTVTPEQVGGIIIAYLKSAVEKEKKTPISQVVISVPAEFDEVQRNATAKAASHAVMEVRRIISEPTAAALAYGLHKKKGVEYIVVVDLGGGTLDVSVLWLQGGVFVTQAMAGNNRLGGQDFNDRVQHHLTNHIEEKYGKKVDDKEDLQQLRLAVEEAKIRLTTFPKAVISLNLKDLDSFNYVLTRDEFESINAELFDQITEPIAAALEDAHIGTQDVDEIVLVGGSTRMPRVRKLVGSYFNRTPNYGIDPELAVVTGASVQAGVIGGGWPLQKTIYILGQESTFLCPIDSVIVENMADNFEEWLDEAFERLNPYNDVDVSVIAVIGKESAEHSKCEVLNAFFDRQIFGSSWCSTDKRTYIEAYFAVEYRTIFLVLHGMNDLTCLISNYAKSDDAESLPNFYEQMAKFENEYNQYVHFLFLISHIVLYVDPGCRFDVSFAKSLSTMNQIRKNRKEEVCSRMAEIEGIPDSIIDEGRFAKELLEKMQGSIERQIISILRTYRILLPQHRSAIACVSDDRFVHVNGYNGWSVDTVKDIIYPGLMVEKCESLTEDERKVKRAGDDFERFLRFHLEHTPEELDDELIFCSPTFSEFLLTSRELYRLLITEYEASNSDSTISTELHLTKALDTEYEEEAFSVYKRSSKENSLSGRNARAYSKAEHEQRLSSARAYLENNYTGSNIVKVIDSLTIRCVKAWECESRPCDVLSINGNSCSLPIHGVPGDDGTKRPQRPHSNMVHYMSCCNCGKSQAIRPDPFTIRDANYEFYEHPSFKCCRFVEHHEFDVFDAQTGSTRPSPEVKDESDEDDRHSIDRVDFLDRKNSTDDSCDEEDEYIDSDEDNLYHLQRSLSQSETESDEAMKELDEDEQVLDEISEQDEQEQPIGYVSADDEPFDDSDSCSYLTPPNIREYDHERSKCEGETLGRASSTQNASPEAMTAPERIESTSTADEDNRPQCATKYKKGSYLDDDQPITFRNPTPVVPWNSNAAKYHAIETKYKGQFLECMPHTSLRTNRLPFHNIGMREQPYMRPGSEFLLPLDVILPVNGAKWDAAIAELNITNPATFKHKRRIMRLEDGTEQEVEKVKLFIGFDYECSRGHRFMLESPGTVIKHSRRNGQLKGNAAELLATDLPIWMPCPCKKTTSTVAQLMRIHVVTPKAPVAIHLDPKVQAMGDEECFTLGDVPIPLALAKYYILRFPFCYVGPNGAIRPPTYPVANATLLKNCLTIVPSY